MAAISDAAIALMEIAGEMACCGGRPLDDNPYCPERFPDAYDAWARGWNAADRESKKPHRAT